MKKLSSLSVVFALLCVSLFSRSAYSSTSDLDSWISQLLASVRSRSADIYAKLHHPLVGDAGCPDLLQHQWDFLPFGHSRRQKTAGLEISSLNQKERKLLDQVLGAVLSEQGQRKVESARRQDQEIHDRPELLLSDRFHSDMYGYDKYELAVFGQPSDGAYMVTLQGHHMYLTIPVTGQTPSASTPLFLGEYPKISELGPQEDAARSLAALIHHRSARGVDTVGEINAVVLRPSNVQGIFPGETSAGSFSFSQMNRAETQALDTLIDTFLTSYPGSARSDYRSVINKIKIEKPEQILFRWEGALTPGSQNHFYVLIGLSEGKTALAFEQENITNEKGEHIHSVVWSSKNFGGL